ncbi:CHASE3 domain-containing protein [Pulveribacter suum]|uniref:Histidine kinase n=1 Tax=Pulveribacter suum TaxID=2116657 RepID=A0A2P1NJ55_9BURK|nr:CHASE3 domain-containing protein [Pulveribacter suum]AVP57056.1 histidine kinase [Pulveribacter suum]
MNWSRLRAIALSLPLALLAVVVMVYVNEMGYKRSVEAVEALGRSHAARAALDQVLQGMLNAETGQRGFLLTGDKSYLRPYEQAVSTINASVRTLQETYTRQSQGQKELAQLLQLIERKLSEMELTLKLRHQDAEAESWRFVLSTDEGREDMDAIRSTITRMLERSTQQITLSTEEIQHSLTLSRMGIAAAAAVGLLAFYLYLRNSRALRESDVREQQVLARERDRLEQLVRERTASLSELAHHLQQIREEERAHLARELHDELGALLTAAKLDVARLKARMEPAAPESAERLQHLVDTLNSGIALKRRIIEDLRPSSLSNLGLTASLEILTREFSERSGIPVHAQLEQAPLSESAQLTVYRLVQEALTNIGKYASPSQVLVSVNNYESHASVQVRDDGAGFDTAAVGAESHGLRGMRHRVETEGGRLTVSSAPGEGTLVSALLPHAGPPPAA